MSKNELIGLTTAASNAIKSGVLMVTSCRPKNAYIDGQRSDKIMGYSVDGLFVKGDDIILGQQITIVVDADPQLNIGATVHVSLDHCNVYARSTGTGYATVELSLHGSVTRLDKQGGRMDG